MANDLAKSAKKVQTALDEFGLDLQVVELSDSTRTAQEAADTIGCTVAQIAKTLVFKDNCPSSPQPVLFIVSGTNRVNERAVRERISEKIQKADADFVLEHTGFAIGGVPPIGHKKPITTYIDQDLMPYKEIWAAAGTPHAVFKLTPQIMVEITNGKIINIK
jgi:prolyl-tRNA editing enzyme YbaK/EbsC (Cys-tRNA(Pro) deacylase)